MKSLQKFASVHANLHNHFDLERHFVDHVTFKECRRAALSSGGQSPDKPLFSRLNSIVQRAFFTLD